MCQEYFKQYGFILKSNNVVCSECRFQAKQTLCISHIQFMHKLLNPECDMVNYLYIKYQNYTLYSALGAFVQNNDLLNVHKHVSETREMMIKTFNTSAPDGWPKWPRRLPRVEKLVSAGFFYTGESDEVMCIECKVILHDWKDTDIPLNEHIKASPDCMLVKLYQILRSENYVN